MINNALFRPSVLREARKKFNPESFDLTAAIKASKDRAAKEVKAAAAKALAEALAEETEFNTAYHYTNAFSGIQSVERIDGTSEADIDVVIRAAYQQVFGNAHLMESERSPNAESQLRSGQITVMEFVRQLAKSDRYRTLFFDCCPNLRAIELNFKHLLGRAPDNYAEISEHIGILANGGFDAEIDSYLDSDEYFQSFGTNIVPYYRGYQTQTGQYLAGFTRSFEILRGASSSDKSLFEATSPQLQNVLLENKPTKVKPLSAVPKSVETLSPIKLTVTKTERVIEPPLTPSKNLIQYRVDQYWSEPIKSSNWLQQQQALEAAATFPAARESKPIQAIDGSSTEDLEIVIRAAYKQVFGNVHLMENERVLTAESKLKNGSLTVRNFIRALAKSDSYRSLFFDTCSNVRAIELNFKHLLGRAPDNFDEISEHISILTESGFEAEIDSYLDSSEYEENFGSKTVPYYVSYSTQVGKTTAGYNRIFQLKKGACSSDRSIASTIASSQRAQLQSILLKKVSIKEKIVFNPEGFDLAEALSRYSNPPSSICDPYIKALSDNQPIELVAGDSVAQQDLVIEAAYKQVFGNAHLMESERLPEIESQLRSGQITVMEFVRQLAKSDRYRALVFAKNPNLRAIELNFKHLLGRAPENHAEISHHIHILVTHGFDAEIDSYLDSDEYFQRFGTNIVPYYRGYQTQLGSSLTGFTHSFQVLRGASSSDKSTSQYAYEELDQTLLGDRHSRITSLFHSAEAHDTSSNSPTKASDQPIIYGPDVLEKPYGMPLTPQGISWQNRYNNPIDTQPIRVMPGSSEHDLELVIRSIYKHVLGNAHLMESERLTIAESQLKAGNISVREFVRQLAKSDVYKSRFVENCPRYRCHELNFKHLLGRAPDGYQETLAHSHTLDNHGYAVDIDSYIDSQEYQDAFGENIVPYYRGYTTQIGKNLLGYTNMFEMIESVSSSDQAVMSKNAPRLQKQLMYNNPSGKQPIIDINALIRKVLNLSY